jgi:dihydrofolate reductase
VRSRSLTYAAWLNTRLLSDLNENAARKAQSGKGTHLMGGGQTVRRLIEARHVDDLRLITYPVIADGPHALFGSAGTQHRAELVSAQDLPVRPVASPYLNLPGEQAKVAAAAAAQALRTSGRQLCGKPLA